MSAPRTAYGILRSCGKPSCHACGDPVTRAGKKAIKNFLLEFLKEWRSYANQKWDTPMRGKDVLDIVIGRPLDPREKTGGQHEEQER